MTAIKENLCTIQSANTLPDCCVSQDESSTGSFPRHWNVSRSCCV